MTATKTIVIGIASVLLIGTAQASLYYAHEAFVKADTPTVVAPVEKSPTVAELLKLVNKERANVNVAPLIIDARLAKSAQQKADDMHANDYNTHIDKNGRHGYDIAHEYAPDICTAPSENLYWGNTAEYPSTSFGAVSWWISSTPHHKAMIDPNQTYTGFGISGTKIVEHFC